MSDDETLPGADELVARARAILEAHWQPEGYTVPNANVYPHQWLWDSCFHAIVWAHLGEGERALSELRNVFAHQADDGFVPHMTYWREPDLHADFWGRRWTSCITQPPMYGHALAELVRLGIDVEPELLERADAGIRFLLRRRFVDGDFVVLHPWESGCDDSPAWDAYLGEPWTPAIAKRLKGELVEAIRFDPVSGSPIASDRFQVAARSFTALVWFNAAELLIAAAGAGIADEFDTRDAAPTMHASAVGREVLAQTLEARLVVLASADPDDADRIFREIADPLAFGGACGPAQVHRGEPSFDPRTYWRGPAWPQLTYLFWVAARQSGHADIERYLRDAAIRGAVRSGFAEYWHPDTGEGFGAVPQSWTGLIAVMARPTFPFTL